MKRNQMVSLVAYPASLGSLLFLCVSPSLAGTMAYWRFEDLPATAQMVHLSGVDGVWSADVADSSGNGNALSVWTGNAWGGYGFRSDVALSTIPQTGAANHYSVENTGGYPCMWNNTLRTWTPSAWTIEATFKPETGGYRTIIGRDSRGSVVGGDANLSALYFQLAPGDAVAIKYCDVSGVWHEAVSAPGAVQGFDWPSDHDGLTGHWYSMAAVSDGTLLSLYLNSGSGYNLVARTDMSTSGSADTALTAGLGSGSGWTAGDFSVGRGLYNGGHTDRAYGFIDEVRLSDVALLTNGLLFAVPDPPSITWQPADITVIQGRTATFDVALAVSGSAGATYQWSSNGAVIPGATRSSYTTPPTTAGDNGAIFCVKAAAPGGAVTSTNAVLTVVAPITLSNPGVAFNFDHGSVPDGTVVNSAGGGGYIDVTGGLNNSGVLKLTDALGGESGSFIITDFNNGAQVNGFTACFAARIGGGSTPRPTASALSGATRLTCLRTRFSPNPAPAPAQLESPELDVRRRGYLTLRSCHHRSEPVLSSGRRALTGPLTFHESLHMVCFLS